MMATNIIDFQNCFIFIFLCFFSLLCYTLFFRKPKDFTLPPSPLSLPIIGHLHLLLSVLIHRSLQKLSSKYGYILYLRIFSSPIVLVSSASVAYEIFRAHDVNISSRGFPPSEDSLFAGSSSFISAPYGDYFKFMKKVLVTNLLGTQALKRSRRVRADELDRFYNNLYEKAVKKETVEIFEEVLNLTWTCCWQVMETKMQRIRSLGTISNRFMWHYHAGTNTMDIGRDHQQPQDTWRLRRELDSVVGTTRLIQETDLPNLPYLQAVVKEGLRLHPPEPIFERFSQEGCRVGGFYVPEKTTIMVNAYAVMRDPKYWADPDEFKPERFLDTWQKEERKEQALKYIPFGRGRRGCPGENLAYIFIGTAIGVMVQGFEWKFKEEKVNMEEVVVGLSLSMTHPLKCTPVARTLNPLILN
ncbi:unnamed protein product [Eruca vesicaria subsp. sativa]|uniref:Cytochrome P450 n=1 Tax=Eruca vesicaria subsp. sativa TaxID=29727 RepID=A0ABC8KUH2_ERUVS|nr:unnamed protein product [Eruca vesicaria subsp. sativa]